MFIKVTQSGNRRYAQLVESFRNEEGKSRQRTVCTLGRLQAGGEVDTLIASLQSALGPRCERAQTRLASIQPHADRWWDSGQVAHDTRWTLDLPDVGSCRAYLLDTLESTLELLDKAGDDDDAHYFYRLCLFHEDMHGEAFAYGAQTLGLTLDKPLQTAFYATPHGAARATADSGHVMADGQRYRPWGRLCF